MGLSKEGKASSCTGKVSFDSPAIAQKASARQKGRHTYRCKHCGKYHVGSDEGKAWRKENMRRDQLRAAQ